MKFMIKCMALHLIFLLSCREPHSSSDLKVRPVLKGENRVLYVGQEISIAFIDESQGASRLEHFSFESALGGTLYYAGKTYSAGELIPVDEGADLTVVYKAAEPGQVTLYFKFMAEGLNPLYLSVPLRVKEAEPPFRVIPLFTAGEPIYVGRAGEIHFKIEHKPGQRPERFTFSSSSAAEGTDENSISYAGQSYKPGETIAIDTDEKLLKVGFVPEKQGQRELRFNFMADDFVDSVTVTLAIQYPFTVSTYYKDSDSLPHSKRGFSTMLKTKIVFLIEPVSGIPDQAKRFHFQSALGGTLTYAKDLYKAGEEIEIDSQKRYVLVGYQPAKTGEAQLHFYFTEGSGKSLLEVTTPLTVTAVPVTLNVQKDDWKESWLKFKVCIDIPRRMSQLEDYYQWRYHRQNKHLHDVLYFLRGDKKIASDKNYPIKTDCMNFEYGACKVGEQLLTFTIIGPYGHENSIEVPITIATPIPVPAQ